MRQQVEEMGRARELNSAAELEMLRDKRFEILAEKERARGEREAMLQQRKRAAKVERDNDVIARNIKAGIARANREERDAVYCSHYVDRKALGSLGDGLLLGLGSQGPRLSR